MMRACAAALTLSLFLAEITAAQVGAATSRPVDSPEAAAVKDAAKAFVTLMFSDDFEPVRAAFAGSKDDLELVRSLHTGLMANRAIHSAIAKKFPLAAGEKDRMSEGDSPEMSRKQIDSADPRIDGDRAVIPSLVVLRKIDGAWRVVDFDVPEKQSMKAFGPAVVKATAGVMAGLGKDQYKTRGEAEGALNTLLADAMREAGVGGASTTQQAR